MIRRFIIHLLGIQSASAAIVSKGDKVLLTKRSFVMPEGGKWCLPGGGMEKWEKAEDCAKRELFEEVGLKSKKAKLLFVHEELIKKLNLHAHVFVFKIETFGQIKPNFEVSEYRWFSKSEVDKIDIAFSHKEILKKYWGGK